MSPDRAERLRRIVRQALELPPAERESFLDDACGGDEALRREAAALLERLGDAGDNGEETRRPFDGTRPHQRLGPFRIVRELGRGGMGIVYEALQEEPLRRRVALKVIRPGLASRIVLRRFEAEREILARMDHPGIARVLDAGETDDGRPWFAMELVRGEPITDYCDRHGLGLRERLELFVELCRAVQHAHQKGVIHRDLKPSNVLVEDVDGKPVPKVIDFGVAKALDRVAAEETLFTEHGQLVGTPEYMSPEQAAAGTVDLDTRTDIYSLGVILYELLTGMPPFDPHELRRAGIEEIFRKIREETPPRPSTKLSSLGDRSAEIARRLHTDPGTLVRICRGDLDWITMKALEKERSRRYASASELAADILRHLRDEPVTAGPPSLGYQARKFVRRHRVAVATVSLVAASLVLGLAGTAWGWRRAVAAEERARLEATTLARVVDFMLGMFEINDPGEARGNTVTAREILDRGAERIRTELGDEPALAARLMRVMGRVYRSLGLHRAAEPLLRGAVDRAVAAHGEVHPEVAVSLMRLAGLLLREGKPGQAGPVIQRALEIQERLGPAADPDVTAGLWNDLGNVHRLEKDPAGAVPCYRKSLAIRETHLGPDSPEVAKVLSQLGAVLLSLRNYPEAEQALQRALDIRERTLGSDDYRVAATLLTLAQLHRRTGQLDEARDEAGRALAIQRKVLPRDHPHLVNTLVELHYVERDAGNTKAARQYLEEAVALARRIHHRFLPRIQEMLEETRGPAGGTAADDPGKPR